MKFIVVLATVFSVSYCLSDFDILPFPTGQKFHPLKRPLLNSLLKGEDIVKCQYFLDNIGEYLIQKSSQEVEDILSECSLLLQKSNNLPAKNDYNSIDRSPSIKSIDDQDNEFIVNGDLTTRSDEEVINKNNEKNEIEFRTFDRNENDIYSKLFYDLYENSKEVSTEKTFQASTESSELRNFFLVNKGSSDNSRTILSTEQNEATSTKKQPATLEYQKTDTDTEILSSINTNWSLWSALFGTRESSGNASSVLVTEKNEKQSNKPEDQNTQSENVFLSPIYPGWSFWNFFSGSKGSFGNSSSVSVTEKNEKQSDKSEEQNTQPDFVILSPINSGWSFWSFFSGSKDSNNSSKENRSEIFFETIKKFGINFENSSYLEYPNSEAAAWNLIMPGTKWCGKGSIATHDDDLGYFADVDRCCRAHDNCDDIMMSGESKYNLTNTSPFTVLNCKCDDEFNNCLSKINSVASNTVGNTFFNIFARMCYTLDYPRKCKRYSLLYLGCLEYEIDKTAEKVYQWKPAKKYLHTPFIISR